MRLLLGLHISVLLLLSSVLNAQFTSNTREGCVPFTVEFAVDTSYKDVDLSVVSTVIWNFGNGETLTANIEDTVSTNYIDDIAAGSFAVYTVSISFDGGANFINQSGYIKGHPELNSDFTIINESNEPDLTYSFHPVLEITDTTPDYQFVWEHFDDSSSLHRIVKYVDYTNPDNAIDSYIYPDTGVYVIELEIRQIMPNYTCVSATSKELPIIEGFEVSNVFSPNSTDYFIIDPENAGVVLYFQLYSRTGIKVFEQEAPVIYWDGRTSSGLELGTGVYYYVVKSTTDDPMGLFTKKGFIHLFR